MIHCTLPSQYEVILLRFVCVLDEILQPLQKHGKQTNQQVGASPEPSVCQPPAFNNVRALKNRRCVSYNAMNTLGETTRELDGHEPYH